MVVARLKGRCEHIFVFGSLVAAGRAMVWRTQASLRFAQPMVCIYIYILKNRSREPQLHPRNVWGGNFSGMCVCVCVFLFLFLCVLRVFIGCPDVVDVGGFPGKTCRQMSGRVARKALRVACVGTVADNPWAA